MRYTFNLFLVCFCFSLSSLYSQNTPSHNPDKVKIHYEIFGKGTPVLIINGGPGMNSEGFTEIAKCIAELGYKTITYDQRGTGKSHLSEINSRTMNMELMVEDIENLRKRLNIDKWVILGHSFGGMLAYKYAATYPESTLGMIQSSSGGMDLSLLEIIDIPSFLNPVERDSFAYYSRKIGEGDTTYKTRYKRGEFLASAYVFDRKHIPVIAHRLTQGNSMINSLLWQDLRETEFDLKEQLKDYDKPTLIIQGKEDILGISLAEEAHRVLSNSQLVLMNDTRHYGWLDDSEVFYSAIKNFLKNFKA